MKRNNILKGLIPTGKKTLVLLSLLNLFSPACERVEDSEETNKAKEITKVELTATLGSKKKEEEAKKQREELIFSRIDSCINGKSTELDLSNIDFGGKRYQELEKLLVSLDFTGRLNQIKKLDLRRTNLKEVPQKIANFTNLEILNLECNGLDILPSSVGKLKKLKKLFLGANKFTKLPSVIGELTNLELLDIHENDINFLPLSLGKLSKLKIVDVSGNLFILVPAQTHYQTENVTLDGEMRQQNATQTYETEEDIERFK